jgi:nucleoside-diphosphate-sugar epimerase
MRIFLAGASGVIGVRLVPLLVSGGHVVAGMTRSPEKSSSLQAQGAEPVVCDVYDAEALRAAMVRFRPDLVLHQLTDLPDDASRIPEFASRNGRMLREGTRNLLAAGRAAGMLGIVAQSIAWALPGEPGIDRIRIGADGIRRPDLRAQLMTDDVREPGARIRRGDRSPSPAVLRGRRAGAELHSCG